MNLSKSWSKTTEPSSYDQIYKFIEQSLENYSNFIDQAEIEYYQTTSGSIVSTPRTPTSNRPLSVLTLQVWSPLLNDLREACLLNDIRSSKTIREMLVEVKNGTVYGSVSNESVLLIERILDKTTKQLKEKIPKIIDQMTEMTNLMEQYFLSFYDIEDIQDIIHGKKKAKIPDEHLETAYTYEKSRWLHMLEVNKSMKTLAEMSGRIESVRGVALSSLSKDCQELAVRCNCTSLSYLFIIPECYHIAREGFISLRTWLSDDMKYNDFIQTSLKIVEEKYIEAKKAFDITKSQLSQIEHRGESQRTQLTKLEQENEINEKKYEEFQTRLNVKEREYLSRRLTFEVYDEQLNKLIKQSEDPINPMDNRLSIERFQQELKQISRDLTKMKSQMDGLQTRIHHFEQRKGELNQLRTEYKKLEVEIQLALEEKILKENAFNRFQHCRDILRNINKCRTTNDLPQKIFYDLPVKVRDHEEDDLTRAIRIISKSIGRDWNRLYWHLPFYPARGQEELSNDIKLIDAKYQRGHVLPDQAMDALNKWRRFHTRAKVDDLTHGLQQIRRADIIQLVERRVLKPKRLLTVEREEIDPRKKEIEDLNRKLNRLFDKMRTGAITSHDTYVYSTMGLDPLRPSVKSASSRRTKRSQSSRTTSVNL